MLCNLWVFALLSVLVVAQSQSQSQSQQSQQSQAQSQSQNVQVTTLVSTGVSLGPNRQERTFTSNIVQTITAAQSAASGSNQPTSSSPSSPAPPLPTAATTIDGGGKINAPIPGATAGGGIYGPDDNYIAAASKTSRNAFVIGLLGFVVGCILTML